MEQEREIIIKDLLLKIMLKWRQIIVCMLIGVILFDGLGIYKSYQRAKNIAESTMQTDINLDEYSAGLEPSAKKAAEKMFYSYKENNKIFEECEYFLNHSIHMQIDPNAVPTSFLEYVVGNIDSAQGLITYIGVNVLDHEWYQKVIEELGWDCEPEDLTGIIRPAVISDANNADVVNLNEFSAEYKKFFKYRIMGLDEESAMIIGNAAKKQINDNIAKIKESYPGITIELIASGYRVESDYSLINERQVVIDKINSANNNFNGGLNYLNEQQRNYFEAMVKKDLLAEKEAVDDQKEEKAQGYTVSYVHKKYILVGAVAGAFLCCLFYFVLYLLSNAIHNKEELKNQCNLTVLGVISEKERKKGIDALLIKIFGERYLECEEADRMSMITAGIEIAVRKRNMKKIHITGASTSAFAIAFHDELKEKLKDIDVTVTTGKSVLYDPASLENMTCADGVVVVEQLEHSIYEDILQEISISEKYNIPLIGAVIIE